MDTPTSPKMDLKNIAWIMYGCWIVGALSHVIPLFGFLPLVALIIALIKQKEAVGTIYESHFIWVIRSFVIGILAALACSLLMFIGIGFIGFMVLAVWGLWRLIKGCLRMYENKPIEDPKAFY